jgi:hypothetical protein
MQLIHPAVFVFGAGATRGGFQTKEIPPPLDSDFFEVVGHIRGRGTPSLASSVLQDVWMLYGTIAGIGLEQYYRDIETRETIGRFAKAKHNQMNWGKRKENLEELIRRCIIQTTCITVDEHFRPERSKAHEAIVNKVNPDDTILTFNYDTVIEEAFTDAKLWSPVGGYGDNVYGITGDWSRNWLRARNANKTNRAKLPIYKLHGGINWTLDENRSVRIKDRPYVVRTGKKKFIRGDVSILPPGWNKRIDRNPYKEFWRQARLELEACASIVIIGYSLPETDILAKAFFSEVVRHRAATNRARVKQLHLCDPDDNVKRKFIELFTPALYSGSKIFRYNTIQEFGQKCNF